MKKCHFFVGITFIAVFALHLLYSVHRNLQIYKNWVQMQNVDFFSAYFQRQDFFIGLAYAVAVAFTVYAITQFFTSNRNCYKQALGGATLTGIIYFLGCFLVGCCGSPMLIVYTGLFGPSFLGFTKPLVFLFTVFSVLAGIYWIKRKAKIDDGCCALKREGPMNNIVPENNKIKKTESVLQEGIRLPKCRKCGCMKETLEFVTSFATSAESKELIKLKKEAGIWQSQMETIKYPCLGCEHCYPAVATNLLNEVYPESLKQQTLSCGFEVSNQSWPAVAGDYSAFCDGKDTTCPVAVTTLASVSLAEDLAKHRPHELCMVGKTETENIGIDKVLKNIVTNPTIKTLIVTGKEPQGHLTGNALLSLWKNGVDENMRIIGANGKRPILRNVSREEIEAFRKQVQVVDMLGCEDLEKIIDRVKEINPPCVTKECSCHSSPKSPSAQKARVILAEPSEKVEMDKAGYFVIIPQPNKQIITVEHYSYDNALQRVIEGKDAKALYRTIIENKWITLLSHAAYLGRELERAELSIRFGFKYVQDGA